MANVLAFVCLIFNILVFVIDTFSAACTVVFVYPFDAKYRAY